MAGALTRTALIGVIGLLMAMPARAAPRAHDDSVNVVVAQAAGLLAHTSPSAAALPPATGMAPFRARVTRHHRLRIIGVGIVIALTIASLLVWLYTRENRGRDNDTE